MTASQDQRNPVDCLAEEFAERLRHGERPSLTEYVEKYPEHAEEIRDIFPALAMMEQLKPATGDLTGAFGNDATEVTGTRLERLGDYRILREVGRGGMGVVYEAEQVSLGRHVALKVLPEQALLNPTHLERFRREAKAAAKLHHTNIVPVYGVGEADGVHFYAMQFIRGEGLDLVLNDLRRMRNQPTAYSQGSMAASLAAGQFDVRQAFQLDRDQQIGKPDVPPPSSSSLSGGPVNSDYYRSVARIALQVAEALSYAHRQGVLHRDIKPSNLLLDAQGTVWVTDFGLAKAEGADELTHTGDIVGTMRFMAPERFDGTSLPQSDIYALGLTLYELLTLRQAFDDSNKAKMIERIAHQPPVSPRKIDRLIPRDLETVVLKCLAKDPADRYTSAEALAEDLRRFLADRPVRARRAGPAERLWRWTRRNPNIAMLLGCVAGLLIAVAAVSTYAAIKTNRALTKTKQAEREGRLREAEALVSQAHATRYSRQVGQRFETLATLEKAAAIGRELNQPPEWFDRLRNEAIAALALPDWRLVREWEGYPLGSNSWDANPAIGLYVRNDRQGHISVRRIESDEEIAHIDAPGGDNWANLSPNGRFLTLDGLTGLQQAWDLARTPPALLYDFKSGGCSHTFHPDGRHVVVSRQDGSLLLYDLTAERPTERQLARVGGAPPSCMSFSPQGDKLVVATAANRVIQVLDGQSGQPIGPSWQLKASTMCVAWHPSGMLLAAACRDERIRVWDLVRNQEAAVLEGWRGGSANVAFTPDGEFVVSEGWEGKLRLWHWRTGRQLLHDSGGASFHFDANNTFISRIGTRLRLLKFADGREYRTLVRQSNAEIQVAFWHGAIDRDGRLLAVSMSDGARLWDLQTGNELAHLALGEVYGAAFAPDCLLTNGTGGLLLWPIQREGRPDAEWQIGPPRMLKDGNVMEVHCSADGQMIARPLGGGAQVIQRDRLNRTLHFPQPGDDIRGAKISPDGRYVATSSFIARDAKIWDTESMQVAKVLPPGFWDPLSFSPDGKLLVVGSAFSAQILRTHSWEVAATIPVRGRVGFSPDSKLLAVGTDQGTIHLFDAATGSEKAQFEDPQLARCDKVLFTPDSSRIIVVSNDSKAVHIWDLKQIRLELARLDLDWDDPPYDQSSKASPDPLRVKVVGVEMVDKLRAAMPMNNEAWRLLVGPQGQRNAARALELVRVSVELEPGNPIFLNTLGVAQYRNGLVKEAVFSLEKSLKAGEGEYDAFDLFFLAMCHAKLGESAKAKDCFDRAVTWLTAQGKLPANWAAELKDIRTEAEVELAKLK
jgi:serine/threonine protein kinase/WD40 repeat protein